MKRKMNSEEELISLMMDHMEISKASDGFTGKVMDRISLETIPSRQSEKPLISNTVWIIIGMVVTALLIYLFTGMNTDPGNSSNWISFFNLKLPAINTYTEVFMKWIDNSRGTLIWYIIGLVTIFILSVLERILRNFSFNRNFIL